MFLFSNGRRSKKAEEAEDSNLVKQAMESKEPVRLTQSPNCILYYFYIFVIFFFIK